LASDIVALKKIINFAIRERFELKIDKETIWFAILQTMPDKRLQNNFEIWRELLAG